MDRPQRKNLSLLKALCIATALMSASTSHAETVSIDRLTATPAFFSEKMPQAADTAGYAMPFRASTAVNAGSGSFAPRLVSANDGGVLTQPFTFMVRGEAERRMDMSRRFSYGFGIDFIIDATKSTPYAVWDDATQALTERGCRPSWVWLQQLYGEVKWRGVYLMAGMKEWDRSLFDGYLGSGDLTLSNNARPIPQVRIGFVDFQDIPFTNGWVQIQGDIAYGKFTDAGWLEDHYNYYNSFITTGAWFHYKRAYFRTNPDAPFSVTVGMQHASQFGGDWRKYSRGEISSQIKHKIRLKDFIDVFYQTKGNSSENPGEAINFNGNHLGSWDIRLRYRFRRGDTLTAYLQKPWEDESGVAWQNGFDGVWGLAYQGACPAIIDGVNVEYLDFTNHSGPMLWDPNDSPGTTITGKATGADDYYNNFMYNGWANYGMSIGSAAFKAPIYNRDGFMRFIDNHMRGFHLGLCGQAIEGVRWRMLLSWISANGSPIRPRAERRDVTSLLAEATWQISAVPGLALKGQIAFDAGSLYRPAFGALASLTYTGAFTFKKNKR